MPQCQRPHMCGDDIGYFRGLIEQSGGIFPRDLRVVEAVEPSVVFAVPVVEIEVVEKGANDKPALVHREMEAYCQPVGQYGDGDAVVIRGDIPMLHILPHPLDNRLLCQTAQERQDLASKFVVHKSPLDFRCLWLCF